MKTEKIDKILQLIKNDLAQENHLFRTLSTIDNPFPLLKPIKDAGYFDPKKNPKPVEVVNKKGYFTIPHWNVLDYLENVAKKNQNAPTVEITNLLAEIINSIVDYKPESEERVDNYRTDWVITKIIFLLPKDRIEGKHVEFVRTALHSKWNTSLISSEIGESIIPKLLGKNTKELLLQVLKILFDYKVLENNSFEKYVPLVESYWLNEALRKHKDSIYNLCGEDASDIVLNIIQAIIKDDKSQFNNVWIPTIEDHSQTSFSDRYECQMVYFVRDCFQSSNPKNIVEKTKWLISQEHPIFQRIALHIINFHYAELSFIFWAWTENPLAVSYVKHELYELLKCKCYLFNSTQIAQTVKWIEEKKYYVSDEYEDDKSVSVRIIAYRKKEWLSALLVLNNEAIKVLYDKYNSINPTVLEHPGFDFWSEESRSGFESPIEEVELLSKSGEEVVNYLNNFKGQDKWNGPSVEGLCGILKKCVSENPTKFTTDIQLYIKTKRMYQHSLLWGFSDAWRSERAIDWQAIFFFINSILISENFWEERYPEEGYNYRDWIISQIADLINDGLKNDQHAFDINFLPEAEKILILLVEKTESNNYKTHDIVTSVLNSNRGKTFTAMINYSLRNARINKNDEEYRWIETIKKEFTKRLNKNIEPSLDFSVVVGENLPSLYYLDKEWVISNVNAIFPKDMLDFWKASFTGYLFYSSIVYSELYILLTENGHYQKALSIDFEDDHLSDRIAQHICVAYLKDWEKFEDPNSLINLLICRKNNKFMKAVINFFWMQRKSLTETVKIRVKPLWNRLFNLLNAENVNEDYFKLISDTSKLLALVDNIDNDIFKWLELAAKHINDNYNAPYFIESLLIHVDKTPDKVAELFLLILTSGFYPDYKKEQIVELITKINQVGIRDNAIRICNLYLNKGFEFTRSILEEIKK